MDFLGLNTVPNVSEEQQENDFALHVKESMIALNGKATLLVEAYVTQSLHEQNVHSQEGEKDQVDVGGNGQKMAVVRSSEFLEGIHEEEEKPTINQGVVSDFGEISDLFVSLRISLEEEVGGQEKGAGAKQDHCEEDAIVGGIGSCGRGSCS